MIDQPQMYETDERWTAVDHYAKHHLVRPASTPYYQALDFALDLATRHNLPKIEVSAEVGTLGGYSSIWLASSSADVKITSVEIEPADKAVAEEAIANAKLGDRIEVLLGAGNDILPALRGEIDAGNRPRYYLVFIDADKRNILNYLNEAIRMCRPKACIIVDNVVRKGLLPSAEAASIDSRVEGAMRVVEAAGADERLECTLLQTVGEKNYDGFLVCVVE